MYIEMEEREVDRGIANNKVLSEWKNRNTAPGSTSSARVQLSHAAEMRGPGFCINCHFLGGRT